MSELFDNAITAIQLGVEDFEMNTAARSLSAARNYYAGALLLSKEVLCRKAPDADIDAILASKYIPVPDGKGNITIEPAGHTTIDFQGIGQRFKAFGVDIENSHLKLLEKLGKIRNDIEHKYTEEPHEAVRQAIARTFPTILKLFELCDEDPYQHLGDAWKAMVQIKEAYDMAVAACIATFAGIEWANDELQGEPFNCSACESELVAQDDPDNSDPSSIHAICRVCKTEMDAESAIAAALQWKYGAEIYEAAKGLGEPPVGTCPECANETYVMGSGCLWCDLHLGSCLRCEEQLTPDNVSWDSNKMCSYCDNVMSKDD